MKTRNHAHRILFTHVFHSENNTRRQNRFIHTYILTMICTHTCHSNISRSCGSEGHTLERTHTHTIVVSVLLERVLDTRIAYVSQNWPDKHVQSSSHQLQLNSTSSRSSSDQRVCVCVFSFTYSSHYRRQICCQSLCELISCACSCCQGLLSGSSPNNSVVWVWNQVFDFAITCTLSK